MTDAPDTVPAAARKAPQPHGTNARYLHGPGENGEAGRCACPGCTEAHVQTERDRRRQIAYGRWEPFVDAGPAREHLRTLSRQRIGWRQAARIAGVSEGTVDHLLHGKAGRPASRRIRPGISAAILAVRPSPDAIAPRTPVDATGTRRRAQALMALGHPLPLLAARLGMRPSTLRVSLAQEQVRACTARAVRSLYEELWNAPPDESTPESARAAAAARESARVAGWPLPLAWDDDAIDDPAACPAEGWQRGSQWTSAGLAEDAAELIARGYTREDIAERLEVKRDTLDAAIARAARRAGAQATTSADTTGERSDAAA